MSTDRYMALFLEESRALLRQGEACLLALEKAPADAPVAPLHRVWHSLKGMAAALGLAELVTLVHAAEEGLPTPAMPPDKRAAALDDQAAAIQAASHILAALPAPVDRMRPALPAAATVALPDTLRVSARELDALLGDVVGLEECLAQGRDLAPESGHDESRRAAARNLLGLRHRLARLRHVPLTAITPSLERLVLTAARRLGNQVRLQVEGAEHLLERGTLELLAEVLPHLLRNALAHGIEPPAERRRANKPETGLLKIRLEPQRDRIRVVVEDDGRGVDMAAVQAALDPTAGDSMPAAAPAADMAHWLCRPGLSTARVTDDLAGRGIGLDAVHERLALAGGSISIPRRHGMGTRVILTIPATLTVTTFLVARIGGNHLGFPLTGIRGLEALPASAAGDRGPLEQLLSGGEAPLPPGHALELTLRGQGNRSYSLQVDQVMGRLQAVVQPMPGLKAGSAILGTVVWQATVPVLVLDPALLFLQLPRPWPGDHHDGADDPARGVSPAAG